MLALILGLSGIMWYVIDRFKELWSWCSFGKYITIFISAVFGFGLAFSFQLDLVAAVELAQQTSTAGIVLTGFALMSGSSAISEIVSRIKGE